MRVKALDGEVFEGEDARDVVRQMKNIEWNAPHRKRDYMAEVIERVQAMTGLVASAEPWCVGGADDAAIAPQDFLDYLEGAGVIEIEA